MNVAGERHASSAMSLASGTLKPVVGRFVLFKKIAVCACALQLEIFIRLCVNQHPIRFNVAVSAMLPFARKRMVSMAGVKKIVVR